MLTSCSASTPRVDAGELLDEGAPCPAGCVCIDARCLCNDPALAGGECAP